jgi:hypothetical protein
MDCNFLRLIYRKVVKDPRGTFFIPIKPLRDLSLRNGTDCSQLTTNPGGETCGWGPDLAKTLLLCGLSSTMPWLLMLGGHGSSQGSRIDTSAAPSTSRKLSCTGFMPVPRCESLGITPWPFCIAIWRFLKSTILGLDLHGNSVFSAQLSPDASPRANTFGLSRGALCCGRHGKIGTLLPLKTSRGRFPSLNKPYGTGFKNMDALNGNGRWNWSTFFRRVLTDGSPALITVGVSLTPLLLGRIDRSCGLMLVPIGGCSVKLWQFRKTLNITSPAVNPPGPGGM